MRTITIITIAAIAAVTLTGCGRALTWSHDVRGDFVVNEQTVTVNDRSIQTGPYRVEAIVAFWKDGDDYRAKTDTAPYRTTEWRWYQTEGGQWMLEKVEEPPRICKPDPAAQAARMVPYVPGRGN